MTRLKFLVFALVVIGLWAAQLFLITPKLARRAVAQAARQADDAPPLLAARLGERRQLVQSAALRLVSTPAVLNAVRTAGPTVDKFAPLRTAVSEALPEAIRADAVIGLVNEQGAIYARGAEAPITDASALDIASIANAGPAGTLRAGLAFHSVQLFVAQADPKLLGTVVIGAPMLPTGVTDEVAKELELGAVAVVENGEPLLIGGPEKELGSRSARALKIGSQEVVARGAVTTFGPMKLPFSAEDPFGGASPRWVAVARAFPGQVSSEAIDVVAVASTDSALRELADFQRISLIGLLALILLSAVWMPLMRTPTPEVVLNPTRGASPLGGPAMAMPPPPAPSGALAGKGSMSMPPFAAAEASPDDFQFGDAARGRSPADTLDAPSATTSEARVGDGDDAEAASYQTASGTEDSTGRGFASFADSPELPMRAGGSPPPAPASLGSDFNPEATRVAAIPEELLKASSRTVETEGTHEMPSSKGKHSVAATGGGDEAHFQEVYREFVAAREKCGEPSDGLTFEKFAVKLRKNRDQLVQKYNCRTVRFQVYVKDGKAALKATPIKD